jgi:glutamate-1-semialdehyde 2,1-aminomutase
MLRKKCDAIFEASRQIIPGGVNSPVRSFPGWNMTPLIATKGEGAYVWDADGNQYVDYCGSWGALILGHAHPSVVEAAVSQVKKGSTFGMATPYELQLAEKICHHLPSIEKIRFVSSGTEATMSAIRVARGYTGKNKIVKFEGHYHGHSDGLLVKAGSGVTFIGASSKGIPEDFVKHTICLPFNDIAALRQCLNNSEDIAAVILEPIAANMGLVPAQHDFIQALREETQKRGIILIFDEVISGFRVGLKGAQGYFGITPDMTCLGKVIGGGFPAAAFGGKASLMDQLAPLGSVYQAGTLSGNPVAMHAGLAALTEIEKPHFFDELEKKTIPIVEALRRMMHDQSLTGCVNHLGSMFTPFFGKTEVKRKETLDQDLYRHFFAVLFEQGIYLSPSPYEASFLSSAHTTKHLEHFTAILRALPEETGSSASSLPAETRR